ncbi:MULTISPECIES: hypothetical protein [unclassified Peribacillus]|nr:MULTISPECIES: hypothetical protein [unclassified Peribacillus]MBK5500173.1 hypothetical protein [Peribacillus sp. TH14]WMX54794.1 hypothetical protein RE409_22460 [Peribacillus sp. R9-11]
MSPYIKNPPNVTNEMAGTILNKKDFNIFHFIEEWGALLSFFNKNLFVK